MDRTSTTPPARGSLAWRAALAAVACVAVLAGTASAAAAAPAGPGRTRAIGP